MLLKLKQMIAMCHAPPSVVEDLLWNPAAPPCCRQTNAYFVTRKTVKVKGTKQPLVKCVIKCAEEAIKLSATDTKL